MMEQRTLDIIRICKGGTKYCINDSIYKGIRNYMADECMVKPDDYTDEDIDLVLWEAMKDYLDHCDKPSHFMWCLKDVMDRYDWEMCPAIAVVFGPYTKVRDNGKYVNGFDDRLHRLDEVIENPCIKCSLNYDGSCCGCDKGREYKKIKEEL